MSDWNSVFGTPLEHPELIKTLCRLSTVSSDWKLKQIFGMVRMRNENWNLNVFQKFELTVPSPSRLSNEFIP